MSFTRTLPALLAVAILATTATGAYAKAPSSAVKACKAEHKGDKAAIKECIKAAKAAK